MVKIARLTIIRVMLTHKTASGYSAQERRTRFFLHEYRSQFRRRVHTGSEDIHSENVAFLPMESSQSRAACISHSSLHVDDSQITRQQEQAGTKKQCDAPERDNRAKHGIMRAASRIRIRALANRPPGFIHSFAGHRSRWPTPQTPSHQP